METISKVFTMCPACHSHSRFFETLAREAIKNKTAREEWMFFYDQKQGPILDRLKDPMLPIGTEIPGFYIATDICMNCGCVYAIRIESRPLKKSIVPPKLEVPPFGHP